MSKNINEIIACILSNEANVQDILLFNDWYNQNKKNKQEFMKLKDYWESSIEEAPMPEMAFEKFKDRLNSPKQAKANIFGRIGILSIAAAIALLVIGSFAVYLLQKNNPATEYYTHVCHNGSYQLVLPDGTVACLNRNSKLTYSSHYHKERRVTLDGEAYFDVVKSADTFTLGMGESSIKVLGTRFNVDAFHDRDQIVVTLEEGSVEFDHNGQHILIAPGQQLIYHKDSADFDIRPVDTGLFTAWKNNVYKYQGITMQELCSNLEQIWAVKIELDPAIRNVKVSISLDTQNSVEQTLNVIKKRIGFDWKKEGDQITIY